MQICKTGVFVLALAWAQLGVPPRRDTLPSALKKKLVEAAPLRDTLEYAATDSIVFDLPRREARLYRQARLGKRSFRLESGLILLSYTSGWLYACPYAVGDSLREYPVLYNLGERYEADSLRYHLQQRRGQLFGLRQQLTEEVLAGRAVQLNPDTTFYAADAYYTTCTARPPHFYIAAGRLKVYKERIISGPLYAVVADVPLPIFAPFGYFPLLSRRSSGLILPIIGEAADRGFFLRGLGYYWAISPYADARLELDLFTRGGFRSELLWTYRRRYWYDGLFSVQYAYLSFNEPGDPDYQVQRLTFVRWQHRQTLSPTASLSANVQAGSSAFLARQSYSATEFLSTNLQSSIALQKNFPNSPWQLTVAAGHTQNLIQRLWSIQLPVVALYQNRTFPFQRRQGVGRRRWYELIGVTYRLDAQGAVQLPESLLSLAVLQDTFRWGARQSLQIAAGYTLFRYFQLAPALTYNEYLYSEWRRYTLDPARDSVVAQRIVRPRTARDFSGSVTLSTRLYGILQVGGPRQIAVRHTLIPSVGFQWRPDFGAAWWGYYQYLSVRGQPQRFDPFVGSFYGSPPLGTQAALSLTLNNLLEARYKNPQDPKSRKYKYLTLLDNFGASASYNLAADSFALSPIALFARTNLLGSLLNLNYTATLDPYVYDSLGRRRPIYYWRLYRGLGTIAQMNWAIAMVLRPRTSPPSTDVKEETFVFFNLPWRLDISYNLVGVRHYHPDSVRYKWIQTLGFSGEVNLTRFWRIQVSSGFDFSQKRLAFTTINIYRDLHCWEMSLNWIPFGPRQSYFFTLSARAPKLQDLRLTKRRDWQDRFVRGL
ncbi:MAG: putative LPS assembly protein LptD [Bacteroidia bacterium]|nr:putative LPS assembly protein LptD [Bacteroidia bacterium]MDW8089517.1 putative LPS assembly protein LptD [Bacteroidia bacterium]